MNKIIERCAKAILKFESEDINYDDLNEHGKLYYCDIAKVVLKEIRAPSNYYCVAIVNALCCYPDKLHCDAVRRVHEAMIDEALKDD